MKVTREFPAFCQTCPFQGTAMPPNSPLERGVVYEDTAVLLDRESRPSVGMGYEEGRGSGSKPNTNEILDMVEACEGGNICALTKHGLVPKPLGASAVKEVIVHTVNLRKGVQEVGEGRVLGYVDPQKKTGGSETQSQEHDGKYSWQRRPGRRGR